jgi:hypothetical protein
MGSIETYQHLPLNRRNNETKEKCTLHRPAMQLRRRWYTRREQDSTLMKIETGGRLSLREVVSETPRYAMQNNRTDGYEKAKWVTRVVVCADQSVVERRDSPVGGCSDAWFLPVVLLRLMSAAVPCNGKVVQGCGRYRSARAG